MFEEKDILERASISEVRLRTWVSRGWITPAQSETGAVYTEVDVARCCLIREFRDDLEIDRESLPVVLKLLDQVYSLRRELRTISQAVSEQPEDIRARIAEMAQQIRAGDGSASDG